MAQWREGVRSKLLPTGHKAFLGTARSLDSLQIREIVGMRDQYSVESKEKKTRLR